MVAFRMIYGFCQEFDQIEERIEEGEYINEEVHSGGV